MKRAGAFLVALTTVIVTSTPVSAFWNSASKCSDCHLTDPAVTVTLSELGACSSGQKPYAVTVSNTYPGMEGWAIFDPNNNVKNGPGAFGSFFLGSGTYEIHGVSSYASWQTPHISGSNKVVAFVPPCPITCTDYDLDGYNASGATCGVLDCNDYNAAVFPGAAEVVGDGLDQDCNGYDLTIVVTKATYNARKTTLAVTATSGFGQGAGLGLVGFGSMTWNNKTKVWTSSVITSPKPATVTVQGFEGSVTVPVQ